MVKYKGFFILMVSVICTISTAQLTQQERIAEAAFPTKALASLKPYLENSRSLKLYRLTSRTATSYAVNFKKGRLRYRVSFYPNGELEGVEYPIKPVDIPNDSYRAIVDYLNGEYSRYKIRRMYQQYPMEPNKKQEVVLREAFQNLLLPSVRYKLLVRGTKNGHRDKYENLFDAAGRLLAN